MTGADLNALAAMILVALGVSIPPPNFAGGLLIAFGFSYGIRALRQSEGQKGLGLTLFIGGIISLLAAILHHSTKDVWLWGALAVQAQMGIAGALSQSVAEGVLLFGRGLSARIGKAAETLRLPGQGDSK